MAGKAPSHPQQNSINYYSVSLTSSKCVSQKGTDGLEDDSRLQNARPAKAVGKVAVKEVCEGVAGKEDGAHDALGR